MFTVFTVFFSREKPVASRQIILSSSHTQCTVILPSKADGLDFLPTSPSPGSPLESTKYCYFSVFFLYFLQCKGSDTMWKLCYSFSEVCFKTWKLRLGLQSKSVQKLLEQCWRAEQTRMSQKACSLIYTT